MSRLATSVASGIQPAPASVGMRLGFFRIVMLDALNGSFYRALFTVTTTASHDCRPLRSASSIAVLKWWLLQTWAFVEGSCSRSKALSTPPWQPLQAVESTSAVS